MTCGHCSLGYFIQLAAVTSAQEWLNLCVASKNFIVVVYVCVSESEDRSERRDECTKELSCEVWREVVMYEDITAHKRNE